MARKKFKLKRGQVDFHNIRWTPVVNCVVKHENKILLVQRSKDLHFYPGYWNGISGFLDDAKSLAEKVCDELREELGIQNRDIISMELGEIFDQEEPRYRKTWIVHPVLVRVKTNKIKLDWEAKNYVWINFSRARKLKLLPGFDMMLKKILRLGDGEKR